MALDKKCVDAYDYQHHQNPAPAGSMDAINYSRASSHAQPGNPLPSSELKMSPAKAKKILKDGSVRGHKLTKKQRGLFGAIAGGKK